MPDPDPDRPRLEVSVTASSDAARRAARGLNRWLVRAAPARARGIVGIAIVSDAAIRRLNRTYRGVNRATDVLSFPAEGSVARGPKVGRTPEPRKSLQPRYLGDIAIALGVASRQAEAQRHPLSTEVRVLALHGLLHLLGYDHQADRGLMARVEERLRRRAGLPVGLIARSRAARR